MTSEQLPIVVDLDGTLLHTDTLHESAMLLLQQKPALVGMIPLWLMKGKAQFKQKVAAHTSLNAVHLPYNALLLDWLAKQRKMGHPLILCTAADTKIAVTIAEQLNIFDEVIASDGETNLSGANKRDALVRRFGEKGFAYAGNSIADLEVWKSAQKAIVVTNDSRLVQKATKVSSLDSVFPSPDVTLSSWGRAMRVHQYFKNVLIFVPLAAAHQVTKAEFLYPLLIAFLAFCLCASAVYIANDFLDLDSDRQHPRKRFRPFAAGVLPISYGTVAALASLSTGLFFSFLVGTAFVAWLTIYLVLTGIYSMRLKRYPVLDCLTLAALYTLRIVAGAAAVAIPLSFWLLAFSIFLFLSLAFIKRYAELQVQLQRGATHAPGRGYLAGDAPLVQTLGVCSGFASIVVFALYLQGETVVQLYSAPQLLWGSLPLLLFWVSWVWLKAHRGEMHDDPIVFALRDPVSVFVGLLFMLMFLLATLWDIS